ncbi:MAG: hypothetical protein P0Y60_01350 [Candidatus Microbacterium colombiense]|nr:MAG: hypothetical protein P0Y60_01350 [Microbacterium sp.]
MVNQAPMVTGERVFRRNLLRATIGSLVLSVVLSAAALFIIPQFLPFLMDRQTRGLIVAVAAVALTAAVWSGAFWFRNIRVVVGADAVEIGRPGNRETYSRATTAFRSKITEHRTNGLRSGTTRALVVHSAGREITIELPGYSRATFNELIAALNPITPAHVDPVEAARARAALPTSFRVDASRERGFAAKLTIVAVIASVVTLAVVALAFTPGFLDGELSALILLAPMSAVVAIGFAIGAAQRRRVARSAPEHLSISHYGLRIGDVDHPYDQLTRIWVTPPAYATKRLKLDRAAGRSITHMLGSSRIEMTPEYSVFLDALHAETAQRPGLLSLDLE